jgi:hypothetical protein
MMNEALQTEAPDKHQSGEHNRTVQEGGNECQSAENLFSADILPAPELERLMADVYEEIQPGGRLQQQLDKLRSDRQKFSDEFRKLQTGIQQTIQILLDEQKMANDEIFDTNRQLDELGAERSAIWDEIEQLELQEGLSDQDRRRYDTLAIRKDQCGPREEIYRSNRKAANIKLRDVNQRLLVQQGKETVINAYVEVSQQKEQEILARIERIQTGLGHIALGVELLAELGDIPELPKMVGYADLEPDPIVNDRNISDFIPPVGGGPNLTSTYFIPPSPPKVKIPIEEPGPETPTESSPPIRKLSPVKLSFRK